MLPKKFTFTAILFEVKLWILYRYSRNISIDSVICSSGAVQSQLVCEWSHHNVLSVNVIHSTMHPIRFVKRNDETQFTILSGNSRPFLERWDPFLGPAFSPVYIQWNYTYLTATILNPNFGLLWLIFLVFTCKLYRISSNFYLYSRQITL